MQFGVYFIFMGKLYTLHMILPLQHDLLYHGHAMYHVGPSLTCSCHECLPWEIKKLVSSANATVSHGYLQELNEADTL